MAAANLFCLRLQQYAGSKSLPLQVFGVPVAGHGIDLQSYACMLCCLFRHV